MRAGGLGGDPALRCPIEEPEAEEERLVDVLDRLDLFGEDGRQGLDPDRPARELLDDRGEELAVRGVQPLVVDLHLAHRGGGGGLVDAAGPVDLGVVAGPLQEPVHDPRRPPATTGDRSSRGVVDRHVEDPGAPVDDRGEVVLLVEVEPVGGTEAVTERGADPPRAGRRADDGERLETQAEAARRRPLPDHDVERVVLHRRVEDLLDRAVQAVDLVDEEHVALLQRGEDRGQVTGTLDRGSGRVADVHPELPSDDRRERRLAQTGRAVQQDVIGRLVPPLGCRQQHREVRLDLALADVFVERPGPERALDDPIRLVDQVRGEHPGEIVVHRAEGTTTPVHIARMFERMA